MVIVPANYRIGDRVIACEGFTNTFAGVVIRIEPNEVWIEKDNREVIKIERWIH